MRKFLCALMLLIPIIGFAASSVFTAKGNVSNLPISRGQMWEVYSDNSKESITLEKTDNRDQIIFKKRGNMSSNGALCYDAYYRGQNKGYVWINLTISGDKITYFYIKNFHGTTYFE